jgi:hypothetical protein
MRLLERPDFEPLLLSMREVAPALDLMNFPHDSTRATCLDRAWRRTVDRV